MEFREKAEAAVKRRMYGQGDAETAAVRKAAAEAAGEVRAMAEKTREAERRYRESGICEAVGILGGFYSEIMQAAMTGESSAPESYLQEQFGPYTYTGGGMTAEVAFGESGITLTVPVPESNGIFPAENPPEPEVFHLFRADPFVFCADAGEICRAAARFGADFTDALFMHAFDRGMPGDRLKREASERLGTAAEKMSGKGGIQTKARSRS